MKRWRTFLGMSPFVTALVAGLKGAADLNKNGWVMASELAAQVRQDVESGTKGAQHPQFVQLEGRRGCRASRRQERLISSREGTNE